MFENLTEKLQRVFKDLRGEGKLTEQNIQDALREIRLALLEADVNFKVVKQLIENIREKALGQEVLTAFSPTEQVVKVVRDELIRILGNIESSLGRHAEVVLDAEISREACPLGLAPTSSSTM